jgi:predicted nucleic acid-binding protein
LKDSARLAGAEQEVREISAILLATGLDAGAVLMGDREGRRRVGKWESITIGGLGIFEQGFRLKLIPDLRTAYRQLLVSGAFVS